ncbi:MAG: queuosine precursor transporter [Dehalococcoidia bacterium]|nr:queuosine precursor transporter [Dehalococcoidia bacterium]
MGATKGLSYSYRFVFITALFITCLLASNILIVKQIELFGLTLPAAVVIFPLSYIFGDVLTEVYGYSQARRVIWLGFFCNLLMVIAICLVGILPASSVFDAQAAYERILGNTPRFLIASFIAYLAGEFVNSYIMARMKMLTKGRWLWTRTIASTVAGEAVDTAIVLLIGFWGVLPPSIILSMIFWHWLFKICYEILATPLTYTLVRYLKKAENLDTYDYGTDFNPLRAD